MTLIRMPLRDSQNTATLNLCHYSNYICTAGKRLTIYRQERSIKGGCLINGTQFKSNPYTSNTSQDTRHKQGIQSSIYSTLGAKSIARAKSVARGPFVTNCGQLEWHFWSFLLSFINYSVKATWICKNISKNVFWKYSNPASTSVFFSQIFKAVVGISWRVPKSQKACFLWRGLKFDTSGSF